MGHSAEEIRSVIESFSTNTLQHGRRLRDMLENSPETFSGVVGEFLLQARDTQETRYVIALLSSRNLLLPFLEQVAKRDRSAASALAALAQRLDPGVERTIAKAVMESVQSGGEDQPDPEFLLGLLDGLNGGGNVFSTLGDLRRSEDPRLRSKLALLLGRTARAQDWFRSLKDDLDPRVRANAIESLWATEGPFAAACFYSGLQDHHQRVVANSLIGLYLQGDAEAVAGLAEMATHADPLFRAATVWAMGRVGDTRFVEILRHLRRNPQEEAVVLRNALQSIGRINQASNSRRRETVRMALQNLTRLEDGRVELTLVARDPNSVQQPALRPTDWQLRAGGRGIWAYDVQQLETANRLAVGFLFPTNIEGKPDREGLWSSALNGVLRLRRANDNHIAAFYGEARREQFAAHTGDILKLAAASKPQQPTSEAAYAHLNRGLGAFAPNIYPVYGNELAEGPQRALGSLLQMLDANPGDRHVVVILDALENRLLDDFDQATAASQLAECDATLHLLYTPAAPAGFVRLFSALALATGGTTIATTACSELPELAMDRVAGIHRSHRLAFQLPPGTTNLEVELSSVRHQGKLVVSESLLERLQPGMAA